MTNLIQTLISGLSLGSIYALIALGYTMVYGIAKMLNFAHGDVIMVGAYSGIVAVWKMLRKKGCVPSALTQNVDDLLQSHTARTMLANSEFIVMLNQASTDRLELAKLLNISDTQLSYITNVDAGHGLIKVGSSLVPFANKFPKNTKLYKLMTTKPGEGA